MDIIPPSPRQRLRYLKENCDLRERTFTKNGWPSSAPVSVADVLDDDFFYVGSGQYDSVQCSYCGNVLHGFERGDNIHIEHYMHSPYCSRFQEVDKKYKYLFSHDDNVVTDGPGDHTDVVTDGSGDHTDDDEDVVTDGRGDHTDDRDLVTDGPIDHTVDNFSKCNEKLRHSPRHKYYGTMQDRLKTFVTWPKGQQPCPEDLANAGLFYTGSGDCCECFYCGRQLDQWEDGDNPQQEHDANFFDICPLANNT